MLPFASGGPPSQAENERMGKLLCRCGSLIQDVLAPNPVGTYLIPEALFNQAVHDVSELAGHLSSEEIASLLWEALVGTDTATRRALTCSECGRMWVDRPDEPTCDPWVLIANRRSGVLAQSAAPRPSRLGLCG